MATVRVIKQFQPNTTLQEDCGMIAIQLGEPRTPQIIRGLEDSDITQLSSPLDRYTW